MKAINWLKSNLHPDGGIRAWSAGPAYPEVTGYLIPTLLDWGEEELATDFADWLSEIQNDDGSFNGIDGIPRTFDTAACYEGLEAIGYNTESGKAREWLLKMHQNGVFWTATDKVEINPYTLRINGILGVSVKIPDRLWPLRTHYIAYALEGLHLLDEREYVEDNLTLLKDHLRNGLAPYVFDGNGNGGIDLCATAQLGCLFMKYGMDDQGTMEALEQALVRNYPEMGFSGGFKNAWTVKFYLDLLRLQVHDYSTG